MINMSSRNKIKQLLKLQNEIKKYRKVIPTRFMLFFNYKR